MGPFHGSPSEVSDVPSRSIEGTIIEVNITTADGRSFSTNVRLTPEDMQLFSDVKDTVK